MTDTTIYSKDTPFWQPFNLLTQDFMIASVHVKARVFNALRAVGGEILPLWKTCIWH